MTLRDRLDKYTKKTRGCWLFTGGKTRDGYGKFGVPACFSPTGKLCTKRAHHVAWCLSRGSWPTKNVLHKCDVPLCIRPDHLFEGTVLDNAQDAKRKGRSASHRNGRWHGGVKNPEHARLAKLNWSKVRRIRKLLRTRRGTARGLAIEYGVTVGAIYHIKNNLTWKEPA